MASDGPITVVSLFAGAGGVDEGVAQACEQLGLEPGEDVELHAINHWTPAIETHEANHPWAEHYHARIEELYPPDVADPGSVTILVAGPECTHFSGARGGKPVNDQKRASAWHVLDWIEKLRPEHVLLENVTEFRTWGPIDENGEPAKDGSIFERWIGMFQALGYSVIYDDEDDDYGVVLNAADYGDPQDRDRLFILASRSKLPTVPPPTHSDDPDDDLPPRRPAADVIDWSDLGDSLWTRDIENPRVTPLAKNTMARIAEGIRRHCSHQLATYADAIEAIGPDQLRALRERAIPAEYAPLVAEILDEPFLVAGRPADGGSHREPFITRNYGTSFASPIDEPLGTVTAGGNNQGIASPAAFCLRQHGGGVPVSINAPLSTVAAGGAIGLTTLESRTLIQPKNHRQRDIHSNPLYPAASRPFNTITADPRAKIATPYLCPMYNPRPTQRPRSRAVDRPLSTVPSSKSPAGLATPFLVVYNGQSTVSPVDLPVPTVPATGRFALCLPEEWPWGLDIRYRMLQPDELKQAQGFPPDYEIVAPTKKKTKKLIGNAVPVNLARELATHLLADETPSLSSYGGGLQERDIDVPPYGEVAQGDD